MPKLLITDDDLHLRKLVRTYAEVDGYACEEAENGFQALEKLQCRQFDLMILDIMMPGMDGIEVMKKLRAKGDVTPILLLTAKAQVEDRILGLNEGADDYLPKPFDKGELIARLQVIVRRRNQYDKEYLTVGNTKLDLESLEITNTDHSLRLSGKEVEILSYFMKNFNKKLSAELIIEKIWEQDDYDDGAIDLYIGYLKNKLKAIHSNLEIVKDHEFYLLRERS